MSIVIFTIFLALLIALSVLAVEYADRMKLKAIQREKDFLLNELHRATQQHRPTREIRKQAIAAICKELKLS